MPSPVNRKAPRRWRVVLLTAGLLAAVLFGLSRTGGGGAPVKVVVPRGASFSAIADTLQRAGVIRSALVFRLTSALFGDSTSGIRPGRYVLPRGAPYGALLDQLQSGRGQYRRLTIPEGWTIQQIAGLMSDSMQIPAESLIAATRDSARRSRMQTPARDVEGYLFPATYEFTDGIGAAQVVDTMLLTFERRWRPSWDTALVRLGRSRHEIVTMASIVEKEAGRASDRAQIAAVYWNRLADGMRLQADPTVLYALGGVARRVLYVDLKVESPYNTYRVNGLPPGPIASPGTASLAATLAPAVSDARFFVAFPDGHSEFRRTFAEHTAAVKAARAARDSGAAR
jgi:UPF0755 protein